MRSRRRRSTVEAVPDDSSRWPRVFAAVYDPCLALGELAGIGARRGRLLAAAHGRVVELGAGTGLNLRHYPEGVDELLLVEPDAAMRRRLGQRVRHIATPAQIVDAGAEQLPFTDDSVDIVVATFVLCTVDDPVRALQEITRVLRPDGKLLFLEHVRSTSPRLARWQERLSEPWRRFACGCRCDRATVDVIHGCGFTLDELAEAVWRGMPPIVRPLAIGHARPGVRRTRTVAQT
jgi:SAM-dependent methyltransferase